MSSVYPEHLSQPIRKEVATYFVWHEFKKLFPDVVDTITWDHILTSIRKWHSEEPFPKPIRSFWNDINAITYHMKLKDLVPLFTSSNISWTKDILDPSFLFFNTGGPEFDVLGIENRNVGEIVNFYNNPDNEGLKKSALDTLSKKGKMSVERENDPIISMKNDKQILILDGNRRVLRNILESSSYKPISYLGIIEGEIKYQNFWVPTTEILKLVNLYKKSKKESFELSEHFISVIAYMIKDSVVAQYELKNRCLDMDDTADKEFYDKVLSIILETSQHR